MGRTFVMGDIHGAFKALKQCLSRADFDYVSDHLIFLGDVTDGWPETRECVDELLAIHKLTYIFGNHDFWTLEWMQSGYKEDVWLDQGGRATVASYKNGVPKEHVRLLENSRPYYVVDNKLFVHAGIDPFSSIENQSLTTFLWDRNLARVAMDFQSKGIEKKLTSFDEVYIGHTPITAMQPMKACEVWLMDTGAGWSGVLSMMDINTKQVFTSDPVPHLYPGIQGRKKRL
jgi:serine/threonine protein phosphatase 1